MRALFTSPRSISMVFGLLLALGTAFPAQAQVRASELKIAVVNLPYILAQSPQAAAARQRMEKDFTARRNRLEAKQKKFVADTEKLKRDASTMSPDARNKAEDDLRIQQREFRRLQEEYNEDVALAEREEMGKLRDVIKDVISKMVEEENYDLVLTEGILHASDKVDITNKVLQRMGN